MIITIARPKAVATVSLKTVTETNTLKSLVATVGELQEGIEFSPIAKKLSSQIAELTSKLSELQKPLNEARVKLTEHVATLEFDPDEKKVVFGGNYKIEIGAMGNSREITDLPKVIEFLGAETFLKIATIKLGDADKYLTLPQREEVITTKRTKRGFKIVKA